MAAAPESRKPSTELRCDVPAPVIAVIDASCREKQSRAELVNEILAAWCGEKVRQARRILRVADDDEGTPG